MMFLLLSLSSACVTTPVDDTPGVECETTIPETWPVDGSTQVYHRGAIEFTLSEADPTATILADFDGTQTTRDEGLVVIYRPTEPLEPDTDYTVTLDYCRGKASIAFQTSELGLPLEDGFAPLIGAAYAADLGNVKYLAGESVGQLIQSLVGSHLLLQVIQESPTLFQLRTALAMEEGGDLVQDDCSTTADLPESDFTGSPYFEHAAEDVLLNAYETNLHLGGFQASGTVAPDGSWIGGIASTLTLDTREAALMLDIPADDICLLAGNLGLSCDPCNDGEPYCGTLVLEDLNAESIEIDMVEITETPADCLDTDT